MKKDIFTLETSIYVLLAVGAQAQTYINEGLIPKTWAVPIGLVVVGLIALKAKLSTGLKPDSEESHESKS